MYYLGFQRQNRILRTLPSQDAGTSPLRLETIFSLVFWPRRFTTSRVSYDARALSIPKVDEPSRPESSCRRQTGGPLVCGGARAAENRGEDERAQTYLEDGRSRARCHYISAFLSDYIVIVLCEIQ